MQTKTSSAVDCDCGYNDFNLMCIPNGYFIAECWGCLYILLCLYIYIFLFLGNKYSFVDLKLTFAYT